MKRKDKYLYFSIDPSFIAGFFLFLITFTLFSPVISHDFINYDDQLYITENIMVIKGLTLEGFKWAFTNLSAGFWFPLTWLSHMLDCQIFGLNPGGHHLISLLIHAVNSLLLFCLFKRMTNALLPSLFVAAIFAVHPVHVEPVAWASSRKDLLSTFFFILTMWSYIYYANRGGLNRYLLVLLFFALGLMAKPILITLPFLLILMDFWPLCRLDIGQSYLGDKPRTDPTPLIHRPYPIILKLLVEKIPLFIFSIVAVFITYIAEKKTGAIVSLDSLQISTRIANALVSYVNYILKSILPIGLSVHYPPYGSIPLWQIALSLLLLAIISFIAIKAYRRHPYFTSGWFWFLGTLVPVIGLVQIGSHSMADRYLYVPLIGLSIVFSWGVYSLFKRFRSDKMFTFVICIMIIPLIILTNIQLSFWQNGTTLFGHAVELNKKDLLAHNNLGVALALAGREEEAIPHFYQALGIKAIEHEVYYNLGNAFRALEQYDKATLYYKTALEIAPDYLKASLNLGTAYYRLHKYDDAIHYYSNVLQIDPNHAGAYNNLGIIMAKQNKKTEASYYFNQALEIDPENEIARKNLNKIQKSTKKGN